MTFAQHLYVLFVSPFFVAIRFKIDDSMRSKQFALLSENEVSDFILNKKEAHLSRAFLSGLSRAKRTIK